MITQVIGPVCGKMQILLSLVNYGCYCGPGPANSEFATLKPIDGFDKICRTHDLCYFHARTQKMCQRKLFGAPFNRKPHFELYTWKYNRTKNHVSCECFILIAYILIKPNQYTKHIEFLSKP